MHKCQCKQTYKQIFNLCQNIKEAIAIGKEVIVLNNVDVIQKICCEQLGDKSV